MCKPIIDGSDIEAAESAKNMLYLTLDQGLKLLHPFMPFVTEELYQRLSRRPKDKIPSIMMSTFPQPVPEWHDPESEMDYEFMNSIVRTCRSVITEYNIKSNATRKFIIIIIFIYLLIKNIISLYSIYDFTRNKFIETRSSCIKNINSRM